MQYLKMALLASLMASLLGCVEAGPRDSTPGISKSQQAINSWAGFHVETMLESKDWGAPNKTLRISGKEYIVYVDEGTRSGGSRQYGTAYSYSYVGCTWSWEIARGRIVGGSASGPTCNNRR